MLGFETPFGGASEPYADCVEASKRVRWEIDADLIRGRQLDLSSNFLPSGLTGMEHLEVLHPEDARLLSQIQGRTYAATFGLVERFINAKIIEIQASHALGDQVALEAMVRFSDEELKHQELFRRIEAMAGAHMPPGYRFLADPDEVAGLVLSKSTWAVLGLTLVIELFTQAHYRISLAPDAHLCPLFKDVFLFHWREEAQHARLDELEWRRADAVLDADARDRAVGDLIDLVAAVDGLVCGQAEADARYLFQISRNSYEEEAREHTLEIVREAYRWQYILSGTTLPRFEKVVASMLDPSQTQRLTDALESLRSREPTRSWSWSAAA